MGKCKIKETQHNDLKKRRRISKSIKYQIPYLFAVHFKYLARTRDHETGHIYYRVRVTKICGIHKCGLRTESVNTVVRRKIGKIKCDLKRINMLTGMLNLNPNSDARSMGNFRAVVVMSSLYHVLDFALKSLVLEGSQTISN